jgi:Fe-S cluster biosynthesis and repair protein YggX
METPLFEAWLLDRIEGNSWADQSLDELWLCSRGSVRSDLNMLQTDSGRRNRQPQAVRACRGAQSNTMNLGATMAHMVFCVRNKKEMEGLDEPPFDSEFGQKIFKNVSKAAWAEWAERQKMLLNEYRLQPWTPQAQQFLVEQMEQFFFSDSSALPSEYVPPTH